MAAARGIGTPTRRRKSQVSSDADEPAQQVEQRATGASPAGSRRKKAARPSSVRWKRRRVALEPGAHPAPAEAVEDPVHAVGHVAVGRGHDAGERGAHEADRGGEEQPGEARPAATLARGVRVEDRPGEERGEGEEEAVGDHDEELPPDRGDDARLEGHPAAALQEVGLHRLGDHRARGQAEHQRVRPRPAPTAVARKRGRGPRRPKESHQPVVSARTANEVGQQEQRQPPAERVDERERRGPGRRSGAPRRAGPATGARGGAATTWRSEPLHRRSAECTRIGGRRRQPVARGAAPNTLPGAEAAIPDPQETRRSTRRSSRSSRGSSPTPGWRCPRSRRGRRERGATGRRWPRSWPPWPPGRPPLAEEGFLALPPAALAERCNGLIESCRRSPRRDAAQAVESFVVFFQALVPTLGRRARARGQGHLLPPRPDPRADGLGGPRRRGGPAAGEPRRAGAARDDPARGLERAPRARRERGPLQEPRPARDPDRGRRVRARPRRGGGAAARDPAQEPRGPLAVPPHGGGGGAPGLPQGAARPRHPEHPDPGGHPGARRVRPAARVRRGGTGRASGAPTSRCSCRTSRS